MTSGPLLRYQALCLDTDAPHLEQVAAFWSTALGWAREPRESGGAVLRGDEPGQELWVDVVPEPITVKHRTHLDVRAADWHTFLDAGATLVDETSFPWVVLEDPEGGAFCAFPEKPGEPWGDAGPVEVITDSDRDPSAIASWWAGVLCASSGRNEEHDVSYVHEVDGAPFEAWVFVPVPEPKTVKNRLHLDFRATRPDAVDLLVERGATLLRTPDDDLHWHVLADPDGNELCVFPAAEGDA